MSTKSANQIRNDFFEFFRNKEHLIVDSAPVVPKSDPTLLFTNAGMNQFKSIFLGEQDSLKDGNTEWKRAANTQKCIRVSGKHNDLEEVGHDTYHHTLFEMLGNWSFGDYFKGEAIEWAWELLVEEWGLNPDRLYVTVFEGSEEENLPVDQESIDLWKERTSINPDHILTFGKKDNFWEMGDTGPCGPCSEVHVDLRPDPERKKLPGANLVNMDDPRVMEIWNLVFIQFNRLRDGSLEKLPAQHVDTGMGFERICAVLQDKTSNYDTDIFQPIIQKIAELSRKRYGDNEEIDIAMRVIADHIRAVSFSIADGASPSNEGRGYVIRRILRRAVRYGWDRLGFTDPFMVKLVPVLANQFKNVFPELDAQLEYVQNVILSEEKSFLKTLGQGIELFNKMLEKNDGKKLSGDDAFKLHDTYGFPIDLTELMAREKGIDVDSTRFDELMADQKKRARDAGKFSADQGDVQIWHKVKAEISEEVDDETFFVGYDQVETDVKILFSRKEGSKFALRLDKTPFYAESGGQIADTGVLRKGDKIIRVNNVQKVNGQFIHYTDKLPDDLTGTWTAQIDQNRRWEIEKHHTVTHLMHAALREELGGHVAQKGSLVTPDKLRFDFSHFDAVTPEQLDAVEKRVNEKIQENISLQEDRDVPIEEAHERGAMMLFGEKYGEKVRVITFDPKFSVELCGGTHVNATGEIGYFRFLSESSAAAGIRRVEAVAGQKADELIRKEKLELRKIYALFGNQKDPVHGIQELIEQNKELDKELKSIQQKEAAGQLDGFLNQAETVGKIKLVSGKVEGAGMDELKQMGYDSLQKSPERTVTVLAGTDSEEGKVYLMASVTRDLVNTGLKAGELVGKLGKIVGGGGGGQPGLATAGGRFPEKINDALKAAKAWVLTQNSGND